MVRRANTIGAKRKHHACGRQTPTQIAIKLTPNYLRKYKYISSNHEIKTEVFKEAEGEVIIFYYLCNKYINGK